eukprot:SAG11_NODE_86_length_17300_cov_11.466717_13_plen_248_part_00
MPRHLLSTVAACDGRRRLRATLVTLLNQRRIIEPRQLHGPLAAFDRLAFHRPAVLPAPTATRRSHDMPTGLRELLPSFAALTEPTLLPLELERAGLPPATALKLVAELHAEVGVTAREIEALATAATAAATASVRRAMREVRLQPTNQRKLVRVEAANLPRLDGRRGVSFTLQRERLAWLQAAFKPNAGPRRPFEHALLALLARCERRRSVSRPATTLVPALKGARRRLQMTGSAVRGTRQRRRPAR